MNNAIEGPLRLFLDGIKHNKTCHGMATQQPSIGAITFRQFRYVFTGGSEYNTNTVHYILHSWGDFHLKNVNVLRRVVHLIVFAVTQYVMMQ